jgi:hypothetical protein
VTLAARWIARLIWIGMIWAMRRPLMKRLQRLSWQMWREPTRSRAHTSLIRQNRFARRYGIAILAFAVQLFFLSMLLTGAFYLALWMTETGVIARPTP